MSFPTLKTNRCALRLPNERDVSAIIEFYAANKDHLAPWEPEMSDEILSETYWLGKVKEAQNEFLNNQSLKLFLFLPETEELIGSANFTRMTRGVFHCCGLGYKIGQSYEGKGYMTESLQAAIHYVFDELHFHRIEANFIPSNLRSEKLLRKLGFVKEGYAKDYLRIAGQWQDHVLNSLTNKNWSQK